MVRSHGFKVREWMDGEGEAMVAYCEVTRPDTGEVIPGEFSVADAKKAGLWGKSGPWQTSPKRMLKMRARGFACRDGAADVLRGFQLREEVEDYQPIREVPPPPPTAGLAARLAAAPAATEGFTAAQAEAHDTTTGEIIDAEVSEVGDDFPGDKPSQQADEPRQEAQERPEGITTATKALQTVSARVSAFRAHVEKTPSSSAMISLRGDKHFAALLKDIDASDPDEVGTSAELLEWLDERIEAKTAEEKADRAKGGA